MAVARVDLVRQAKIERDKQVVAADQDRQTTVIIAEGHLSAQKREADGIMALGEARAFAERALQGANVKVIANAGRPGEGMNQVMDLFTAQGGTLWPLRWRPLPRRLWAALRWTR